MGFLSGKRALIVGVASDRSIASGIAEAMHREGASIAFSYQNDKLKPRVTEVANRCQSSLVFPCDVAMDDSINTLFAELKKHWSQLDILVHSVAYAPADQLEGDYLDCVSREGFRMAHDVSSYSLAALSKAAKPMMQEKGGSILTLSYLGAERTLPYYNVMGLAKASLEANVRYLAGSLGPLGIRVNAVSAGPIKTLAAVGIKGFRRMLALNAKMACLKRTITVEEVSNSAAFLCSDLASGITGEVLHVDGGVHCVAMCAEDFEEK